MRRTVFAILSTIVGLVLLLTFKTQNPSRAGVASPPAVVSPSTSTSSSGSSSSSGTGSSSSSGSPSGTGSRSSSTGTSSSTGSSSGARTISGTATDTRYGPVQVQITVTNGKVTAVQATEYPEESGRDQEINSSAIPQLNDEATSAKSAQIDTVSGATYTSEGYITSLQSALDQAGVA